VQSRHCNGYRNRRSTCESYLREHAIVKASLSAVFYSPLFVIPSPPASLAPSAFFPDQQLAAASQSRVLDLASAAIRRLRSAIVRDQCASSRESRIHAPTWRFMKGLGSDRERKGRRSSDRAASSGSRVFRSRQRGRSRDFEMHRRDSSVNVCDRISVELFVDA
jgi:hypothetical protein